MIKNFSLIVSAAALAVMMASCGGAKTATIAEVKGEWQFETAGGKTLSSDVTPYIYFGNNDYHGNAGCNSFRGSLKTDDKGNVDFGVMAATKMMCPNMDCETAVMKALGEAKGFSLKGNRLTLHDIEGKEVATLISRCQKMKHSLLQGEWRIVSAGGLMPKAESKPTIWFDTEERLVHGNAACNTFNGDYSVDGQLISFAKNMAITMRMCDDMAFEIRVMEALGDAAKFGLMPDGSVGLFNEDGSLVMLLAR